MGVSAPSLHRESTDSLIVDIDKALCTGEYHRLMEITQSNGFESLISNDVEASYEQCTDVAGGGWCLGSLTLRHSF